jgi:DNA-binding GntR family transcriptional regulator
MPIPKKTRPIQKPRVSDQIYDILRRWIIDGGLAPGEDLKDADLAARLGVSRTPVREALKLLESEGLVDTSASRWTRVAEIRAEDVDNLFPIIKCLDLLALSKAFPSMNPDGVAAMKAAYRRQEEALAKGDQDAVAKAGRELHNAYVERCNNPELIDLNKKMKAKARRLRVFFYKTVHIEPATALEEHLVLIQAIEEGRLGESEKILSQHWDHVTDQIRTAAIETLGAGDTNDVT